MGLDFARTCWFCEKNPLDDEACLPVDMYYVTNVEYNPNFDVSKRTTYRTAKVMVPRCMHCRSVHEHESSLGCGGSAIGGVIGIIGGIAYQVAFMTGEPGSIDLTPAVLGGAVGAGIGTGISYLVGLIQRPSGVKPGGARHDHPDVKRMISRGWLPGESP